MRPSSGTPGRVRAKYPIRNDSGFELSKPCVEVMCGPVLSRLCVFSDDEWARLKVQERPPQAVFAEGLGWVAAVRCHVMN
jgi:hypothetical protein